MLVAATGVSRRTFLRIRPRQPAALTRRTPSSTFVSGRDFGLPPNLSENSTEGGLRVASENVAKHLCEWPRLGSSAEPFCEFDRGRLRRRPRERRQTPM